MRKIFCIKYQKELPGLEKEPMPGEQGKFVYENVSALAWEEWLRHQTMLINEKRLQLFDVKTRAYLKEQMHLYMENKNYDKPAGYVAPEAAATGAKEVKDANISDKG